MKELTLILPHPPLGVDDKFLECTGIDRQHDLGDPRVLMIFAK